MSFCTAINCMDGRTQLPVNEYLRQLLNVDYVDTITEAGPVRILAEEPDSPTTQSILARAEISVGKHGSQCIAIVAHHGCAGNPVPEQRQKDQLVAAREFLLACYPTAKILALWVDTTWSVVAVGS